MSALLQTNFRLATPPQMGVTQMSEEKKDPTSSPPTNVPETPSNQPAPENTQEATVKPEDKGLKTSENTPLPVFDLRLKAKVLLAIFAAIATLIDEATFKIAQAGISLKAMDPSRVAMVVFEHPREAFDEFSVSREGLICIDIEAALKILRRADKDDNVQLSMRSDSPKLLLKIHGKYERTFDIPSLEPSTEEIPSPKLSHDTTVKITVQGLIGVVEDLAIVSDHFKIIATPNLLQFKATGDVVRGDINFAKGMPDLLDLQKNDATKPTTATFSLEYFKEIVKNVKDVGDTATLQFATDMPIQIDIQNSKGSMRFYQAPRIEVES